MSSSEPSPGSPDAQALRKRRRRRRFKLIALGIGLFMAFLLAETGTRVMLYLGEQKRLQQWDEFTAERRDAQKKNPKRRLGLGDIIRPSEHHDVIYELCPDLDVTYVDGKLTTNEHGFRGPSVAQEKAPGVFRIIGLGDSVMFGHGVNDGEEYLQVMARKLNEAGSSKQVEVVNMATSGYNTAMEVASLETRGLAWSPDLVVIDFVRNDYSLPNFIATRTDYWALDRSFFVEWLGSFTEEDQGGFGALKGAPRAERGGGFEQNPERAPEEYRHLVGQRGYRTAMERLAALSKEHGFAVVVTMHRYGDPFVQRTCEELGIPFVLGQPPLTEYEAEKGIEQYFGSELTVSENDPHPSKLQHRLLGEYYAQQLLETGFLR